MPAVAASLEMEAATPPDDDEETDEGQSGHRPGISDGDILLAGGGPADDVAAVEEALRRQPAGEAAAP